MKPQTQLRKTQNGDCLRACLATLLECRIETVPDFALIADEPDPAAPYPAWWLNLQGWLSERGFWLLEMHLTPSTPWMPLPFPALCIFFGETESGVRHAIVGRAEGGEFFPVFNPWPEAQLASGVGALGLLIPRDPATLMTMGRALEKVSALSGSLPPGPVTENVRALAHEALGRPAVNAQQIITDLYDDQRG